MQRKTGFTLIELSIVLVIIALIVGGVLIGRDLIEASTVRAQVRQIDQVSTAVNTFWLKYNGIPGDLEARKATGFGFLGTRTGLVGDGNGDGRIQHNAGAGNCLRNIQGTGGNRLFLVGSVNGRIDRKEFRV